MYPSQPEYMYPSQPEYVYLPQEQEVYPPQEDAYRPQEDLYLRQEDVYPPQEDAYPPQGDVVVFDYVVKLEESKSIPIEGAAKLEESESVTILWWKPGREEEPRIKLEESDSVTILSWTPGEEEKPRIKDEGDLAVLPPVESAYDGSFTTSALLVPKEEEDALADPLPTRTTPVAIKVEASPSIEVIAVKLEASPSIQVRQEPDDDLLFGHYDTDHTSFHDAVSYASRYADDDIEMVDEPLDVPKVEPVEGVLPLPAVPFAHSAEDVEMVESSAAMDVVEEDVSMSDYYEAEPVAAVFEVKVEDDSDIVCLDERPDIAHDHPPVMVRAESLDDALLLAGAFVVDVQPALAFEVKEEDVDIDIVYLHQHSVVMDDAPPVAIYAESPVEAPRMHTTPVIDIVPPIPVIKVESSQVDLLARATPEPIIKLEFIKQEVIDIVFPSDEHTAATSMDPVVLPAFAEDIVMANAPRARKAIRHSRRREKHVTVKIEPVAHALEDLPVKHEYVDVSVPDMPDCDWKEESTSAPEINLEVAGSLSESDSIDSFYTASESFSYMSASPSVDSLTAESPSVVAVLEEFACSPPLALSTFDDADLWTPSTSPSSAGFPTCPTVDNLAINILSSPEFASNFAQAQFPSLVFRSFADVSYIFPWFRTCANSH